MKSLRLNIVFAFLIIIPFFGNIYPQSKIQPDTSFSYYKFLPYYERFRNDSIEAEAFRKNRVKSVSDFTKSFRFGKYEKGCIEEKREYNNEGFLVKITYPEIRVFRGPTYSIGNEDNRIDSITYIYDKENHSITEFTWIRRSPEIYKWLFDSYGRLYYVDEKKDNLLQSNEIINYDLDKNRIVTIDTNKYFKVNGKIYELSQNKISRVLVYNDKDTIPYEIYMYAKNKLTIMNYENGNEFSTTTRHYNSKGKLIKEVREIDYKDIITEEYIYGENFIEHLSYKRDIETSFSIFKSTSRDLVYFNKNGLPELKISKWWNFGFINHKFIYEYYE